MINIGQTIQRLQEAIRAIVAKIKAVGVKISGSDQVRVSELANLIHEIDLDVAKALIHVGDPAISITCEYSNGVSAEDRLYGSAYRLSSRFQGNTFLTSADMHILEGDTVSLDTPSMFASAQNLSKFTLVDDRASDNLPSIASAANMFYGCSHLTKADIKASLKGSCDGMFSDCESLESVVLHDVSKTSSAREQFLFCENLKSLSYAGEVVASSSEGVDEDTYFGANIEDATSMFNGCSSLKYIAFNCASLRCADGMFSGCSNLERAYLPWTSDFGKRIPCESMFEGCGKMTKFVFNDYWGLRRITDARSMFSGCASLTRITSDDAPDATASGASYFEFGNSITDAADIFRGCSQLKIFPKLKIPVSYSIEDLPITMDAGVSPTLYFILKNLPVVSTTQTLTVSYGVAQEYKTKSVSGFYSQVKPSTLLSTKNWKVVDPDGAEVTDPA